MTSDLDDMFRPPVNRSMRLLDRSFFVKDTSLSAARVLDIKNISKIRDRLMKSKDILALRQTLPVHPDPTPQLESTNGATGKCILLKPEVMHHGIFPVIDFSASPVPDLASSRKIYMGKNRHRHGWLGRDQPYSIHSTPGLQALDESYVCQIVVGMKLSAKLPDDILSSVLPVELLDDMPTAFSHAGHIGVVLFITFFT